ncbi:TPA: DUF389 domain-containing protein [Streptococcus suis]|nr:DUF389 domain-containing protein [Streptococcus suis]
MKNKYFATMEYRDKLFAELDLQTRDMVILMCAIVIASVGLNMNATAVIIGAMLISPLMTPIVGLGLGLAIYDLALIKKALKLLAVEVVISLLVSSIYFYLSPITVASTELTARVSPTVWDIMIAIAGGIAGVIGSRKKEANNIVPGVAIATALMPPICTAGFGLAHGNTQYFFGALYLFLINCIFIMLTTFFGSRFMMRRTKAVELSDLNPKLRYGMTALVLALTIPSLLSAGNLVLDYALKDAMNRYVSGSFTSYTVLSRTYSKTKNQLEITIIGQELTEQEMEKLVKEKSEYGLEKLTVKVNQVASLSQADAEEVYQYIDQYIEQKLSNTDTRSEEIQDEIEVVDE